MQLFGVLVSLFMALSLVLFYNRSLYKVLSIIERIPKDRENISQLRDPKETGVDEISKRYEFQVRRCKYPTFATGANFHTG